MFNVSMKDEVRQYVDPLLLTLRESLYGSGVSFGRVYEGALPTTVIYTTNIEQVVNDKGFIKGIATYDKTTLVASNQTQLSFSGFAFVTSVGSRTTIGIAPGLTNPMSTLGDIIYGSTGGTATALSVGSSGQVLIVSGGRPIWKTLNIPRQLAWYEDGTLTSGTSKGPLRRVDSDVILRNCYTYVKTFPAGASGVLVDIKRSTTGPAGTYTSILTSYVAITTSSYVGSTTSFTTPYLSEGDYLRMDIIQIGSISAGQSLTVDLNMFARSI